MKDHGGDIRGFYWLRQSWYAEANLRKADFVDEIMFGLFNPDGGTSGEMCMKWYDLSSYGPAPRLEVFHDAWDTLWIFRDVLEALAKLGSARIEPQGFAELLTAHGFADLTRREQEYGHKTYTAMNAEGEMVTVEMWRD